MVAGMEQVRVMVVSAAPYTRYVISGELSSEPDVFVVGTAQTTDEISEKRALLRPDPVCTGLRRHRSGRDRGRGAMAIAPGRRRHVGNDHVQVRRRYGHPLFEQ